MYLILHEFEEQTNKYFEKLFNQHNSTTHIKSKREPSSEQFEFTKKILTWQWQKKNMAVAFDKDIAQYMSAPHHQKNCNSDHTCVRQKM